MPHLKRTFLRSTTDFFVAVVYSIRKKGTFGKYSFYVLLSREGCSTRMTARLGFNRGVDAAFYERCAA
jgi:hypothetical protein